MTESPAAAEQLFFADRDAANALMAPYDAGAEGTEIFVTLLCPESNSFLRNTANVIAQQLAQVNVTVTVENVGRYDYNEAIETGEFDLYLGEIKLPPTMRLDAFFHGGAASYGINANAGGFYDNDDGDGNNNAVGIAGIYDRYCGGEITFDEFVKAFAKEMPFIPLCYRNGRMCYTSNVSAVSGVTEYRLFGDIGLWTIEDVPASG